MYNFPENFYSDVRIERIYHSTIRIEMGRLEEIKESVDLGAFIRLFDGSRWYYSSTTELDSIDKELHNLAGLAKENKEINNHPVVKRMQQNVCKQCIYQENSVEKVNLQDKLKLLETYSEHVIDDSDITHWNIVYSDNNLKKNFYSSIGSNIEFDSQIAGVRVAFRFGSGANSFTEIWCKADVCYDKITNLHSECESKIAQAKDFYKNAETIPGGNYTVVLSPMAAGIFAHESFGHKSEADFMVGDEEMLKEWQLGKRVGSEKLSIIDDGNVFGSGYVPFDDEGSKAAKTVLIENGILRGRLHSSVTAADLNEDVTGNARGMNFEFEPIVRMTCTYIDAGNISKEQLISEIKYGILVDTVKHGSGMSTFTLAPSMAYLIENGQITKPVKFSVITGNVMKTLNQIDGVSDKLELLSFVGGGCGKMEQFPLAVGFGGPFVRVKEINVQ
ncbi:MAG: TldD/PmbA family protein [Candidatus Riflebacteria bacterium]|nr:TldD/PmbA family protein [Candidatus Riflebacteria bacterium]